MCSNGNLACTEYLNLWRDSSIELYLCTIHSRYPGGFMIQPSSCYHVSTECGSLFFST